LARRIGMVSLIESEYRPQSELPLHQHEHANFCIVVSGGFLDEANGRDAYACEAPAVLYRPPGEAHAQRFAPDGCRCLNVELPPQWAKPYGSDFGAADRPAVLSSAAVPIALRLYFEFCQPDHLSAVSIYGLLLHMYAMSARAAQNRDDVPPIWWLMVRDLCRHPTVRTARTVSGLAAAVGVTPRRLTQAFARFEHCTASEYLRALRLERACALLNRTSLAAGVVATEAGYCDQSHLSREFRSALQMTPLEYRHAQRAKLGR
jgi:AraC family transcriptional regulator